MTPEEIKAQQAKQLADAQKQAQALQVSADTLANPPTAPALTPPAIEIPPTTGVADAVAVDTAKIVEAQTTEAANLRKARQEFAQLGQVGTLAEFQEEQLAGFGVPESVRQLKDIQLQLSDIDTASELQQAQITAAPGQVIGQAQREVTQEQRENAVRRSGLAAQASILQGNIETATTLVNSAVDTLYKDRTLTNNNLINQINDLSGTVDSQTQQLLDQAKAEAEADQAAVKEVKDAVNSAMVSGASPQEVAQLTDINATDETRLALAQSIVARGATEVRALDIAAKRAQLTQVIDRGDGRKQLINKITGEVISNFGSGTGEVVEFTPQQETIASQDIIDVDGLKTHSGMSKGVGVIGLARFTPFKADVLSGEVSDFIASVDELTKGLTLNELATAKERGITFGALSEGELGLIADAATKINSWRATDEGRTTHFATSEEKFKEELDTISNFKKLDFVLKGGDPESVGIRQTNDGAFWTINSDGTFTKLR